MRILVLDTETSGIPEKGATYEELNKFPYILQISYIFYDVSCNNTIIKDHYINITDDVIITPVSYDIHKISRDFLNENGKSIHYVLNELNEYIEKSDIIVGHNIQFDKRMIIVECLRNNIKHKFTTYKNGIKLNKKEYCTMNKTKNLCKILKYDKNNKAYFKYPKLIELYQFLYPEKDLPTNLHNSLVDILITFKCYMKIVYNIDINKINKKIENLELKYGF